MNTRRAVVLVVGVMAGLTARAALAAGGAAGREACALVTPAEVSSALGAAVGPGQPIGATGCSWSTADDPGAKAGHLMITLSIWDEKRFPKGASPGLAMKPAGGIGEDAAFLTLGDLTSLFVKKDRSALQLRVYGLHDTARQEQIERSVAEDALARW